VEKLVEAYKTIATPRGKGVVVLPYTSAWSFRERLRCGDTRHPYGGDMAMETTPTRGYEGQAVRGTALQLCDFGGKHGRPVP
jgi:hypothetical protein